MATRNEDQRRRIRHGTKVAMRRLAVARQCSKCGRKMAVIRVQNDFGRGRVCRWPDCGHVAYWSES